MLAEERRMRIVELLQENKSVEIAELSQLFSGRKPFAGI